VPEDTRTDWERLRAAFEQMRKEYHMLALDEPQPDEPWIEVVEKLNKKTERAGKTGNVCFTEEAQNYARESGVLGINAGQNSRVTIGHWLVKWLFNANALFAVRDAEKKAFVYRVTRILRLNGLKTEWEGELDKAIRVHGKWD
jgi:hypothetical protein